MLPDGSNPEGVDPEPPLGWTQKTDLKDVKLYAEPQSFPCCKIIALLIYHNVPFELVKKKKPNTDYKKMPVLDASGRQVNDSGVILRQLMSALGITLDPDQLDWANKITYVLDPTIRDKLSKPDCVKFAVKFFGVPGCCGCCVGGKIQNKIKASGKSIVDCAGGQIGDEVQIAKDFKSAMGLNKFFGGVTPGTVDIAFYGQILPLLQAKCEMPQNMIREAVLDEWLSGMYAAIPPAKIFCGAAAGKDSAIDHEARDRAKTASTE